MLAANISERRGGCLMKHPLTGKKPSSQSQMGFFDTVLLRILAQLHRVLAKGKRTATILRSSEFLLLNTGSMLSRR
jgi:hypothetical protein